MNWSRTKGRLGGVLCVALGVLGMWLPWNVFQDRMPVVLAFAPTLIVLGAWAAVTGPDVDENIARSRRGVKPEPKPLLTWLLVLGLFASFFNALAIVGIWNPFAD